MDKVALDVKALETWELANTSLWFVLQVNLMVRWQVRGFQCKKVAYIKATQL